MYNAQCAKEILIFSLTKQSLQKNILFTKNRKITDSPLSGIFTGSDGSSGRITRLRHRRRRLRWRRAVRVILRAMDREIWLSGRRGVEIRGVLKGKMVLMLILVDEEIRGLGLLEEETVDLATNEVYFVV